VGRRARNHAKCDDVSSISHHGAIGAPGQQPAAPVMKQKSRRSSAGGWVRHHLALVSLGTAALVVVIALALVLVLGAERTAPAPGALESPYRGLRAESLAGAGVAATAGSVSVDGWIVPAVARPVDGWLVPAVARPVDGWLVPAIAQPYDPMQQGALYDPR
jgi:hypothetical protein